MNIVIVFLIAQFGFVLSMIRSILFWVALWQLKEYRMDRLLIHFRETNQGKAIFLAPMFLIKLFAIVSYFFVASSPFFSFYYVLVTCIFIFDGVFFVIAWRKHMLKRPILTTKALCIMMLTFFVVVCFLIFPPINWFFLLLVLDVTVPLILFVFVQLFALPTIFYKQYIIAKAIKKIAQHKDLIVIGVTGSFGKSSTKEYIAQVLTNKFIVLSTPGTNNTPIGIARTILSGLTKKTQVFVVEMGAYKKGEIKQMCDMVHPQIGVLTAVSPQHLSLFGSIENTMSAKYELIESLPQDGLALFNGDNENAVTLYNQTNKKKILYGTQKKEEKNISASAVKMMTDEVSFTVVMNAKKLEVTAPLVGMQNVTNILPAIYIAHHLGMGNDRIKKAVGSLQPIQKTMKVIKTKKDVYFVDDTFNANPEAVLMAIDYAKIRKGKKILVLQPMIELGPMGGSEHMRVAKAVSSSCDYLLLTNKNFYQEIIDGVKAGSGNCKIIIGSSKELAAFLHQKITSGDVVIFEGKEAAFVLKQMESYV